MVDPVFVGLAVLTVGSAIIALETRELIYGAIGLAISMLGIAGFFLILDAPFVAMFQIAVYVGAVAVLLIFTVMLVRTQALFTTKEDKGRKAGGIVLMLFIMGGLGALLLASGLNSSNSFAAPPVNFMKIGQEMLTYYAPVLIVLGLVLAGSVIAALALARREDIVTEQEEGQQQE
ncbi:NADH dehydrogenase subunit J [Candidatus Nitrososphaera evergladensis SR1]|jgi:NADH:ubiquinone oxidoreductase subunit 6 (subunit J)|uniref:NADH dehydrogenase subunit J n=1 Tax=Candidatus Nitrososphaera evergladensis SR1 TaxID=1459636 RepID=A0A075MTT5_9ARCH|nr:NADH-quinone oxidoreductase subunit J [Candidatus Nitrososphaera evergladensis]AIF84600.1 NADH dehydrogenase subunit J [Candidatus Nitrososphaera evergladensis SR1]